ncbi:MAG: START-like domain-containing protein [Bacteroidota bacterium]
MTEKIKVQLEYVINCSPRVLYNRLSSASGLAEWFADDVRVRGNQFTFIWEGAEQVAEMSLRKENRLVRFNWLDDEGTYFEFKITQDELTGDVSLIVVDFAEVDEVDETKELWNTQIHDLKRVLGS